MGKRSTGTFERRERDYYPTPFSAVKPLLPRLEAGSLFIEPCAGDGRLIKHLQTEGHICTAAFDIEPLAPRIKRGDAISVQFTTPGMIITNPPWTRSVLHPMIENFSAQRPTWLLFDADWMHTKQSADFIDRCKEIVSIGRVAWFDHTWQTGKDSSAWYLFDNNHTGGPKFYGQTR